MSGSGTNRLVQSDNAMEKGSESSLTKALENANESAIRSLDKKKGKKAKK